MRPPETEVDERGAAWLTDWLGDVLAGSRPFETTQTVSLNAAVRQIVSADPRLRTFDGLATLVASTDDEGDLVGRVREWGQGGRHGWLFGPGASAEISLSEDVVGIDMSEILDLGTERSALLAYLFRRIERVIEDRRPTLIVIDEAWKMLDDPIFEKRLHDWLVTMRKKNAVVMMMTQTLAGVEGASAEWGNMSSAFIGYSGQQSGQIEAAMARIKGFLEEAKPQTPKEAVDQNTYMLAERARLMALTLRLRAGAVKVEAARGLSEAAQSLQYTTFWEYTP